MAAVGGPGDSGLTYLQFYGPSFREIVGPQFDLVSFDPRGLFFFFVNMRMRDADAFVFPGVGETTPPLTVFSDEAQAAEFYAHTPLNANESISSVGRIHAMYDILGRLGENDAKAVAESISTPNVARDMLSIVHAFGQEKLQYWGVS